MKAINKALVTAASVAGLMGLLAGSASAAPMTQISFTWNPNGTTTPLTGPGSTFTSNDLNIFDVANINATNPLLVTEHAILVVSSVNTTAPGLVPNNQGGVGKYQLYFDVNANSALAGPNAGTITSLLYTFYGVQNGGCNAQLVSGLATVTGCGTKVTLATGALDPTAINDVGFKANGAPYADANATIIPNATQTGFYVNPDIANIALDIFQSTFTNNADVSFFCTGVNSGCVSAQNGGRYAGGASPYIQIRGGGGEVNVLAARAVPEPLTLSIFGAGLAGIAAMRRRRSKKA